MIRNQILKFCCKYISNCKKFLGTIGYKFRILECFQNFAWNCLNFEWSNSIILSNWCGIHKISLNCGSRSGIHTQPSKSMQCRNSWAWADLCSIILLEIVRNIMFRKNYWISKGILVQLWILWKDIYPWSTLNDFMYVLEIDLWRRTQCALFTL